MAKSLQLTDGTVLDLKVNPMKRWKKFAGRELLVTALVSLFPALDFPLDDTMYAFFSEEQLPHFLTVCLAVSMVYERYRQLPEYVFDDYFAMFGQRTFSVCVDNNGIYCHPEGLDNYSVKQVTVSGDAVSKLQSLLSNIEVLDEVTEMQVVTEEFSGTLYDTSPSVDEPRSSTTRYMVTHSVCRPGFCNLCDYVRAIPYCRYGALNSLTPAPGCQSYSYDPQPLGSVMSLTQAKSNENIIAYGATFARAMPQHIPSQLHELDVDRVRLRVRTLPRDDSGMSLGDICIGSMQRKLEKGLPSDVQQKHLKIP